MPERKPPIGPQTHEALRTGKTQGELIAERSNPDPESYGPEGGHMGITLRQTEVDLEDVAARMRRYEAALTEAYRCLTLIGHVPRKTRRAAAADVIYHALHPDR